MDHKNSASASYAAAGVDITAGYKAVELMKAHVQRTQLRVPTVISAVSEDFLFQILREWQSLFL